MGLCESEKFSTTLAGRDFVEWDLRACVCVFFFLTVRNFVSPLQFAVREKGAKL